MQHDVIFKNSIEKSSFDKFALRMLVRFRCDRCNLPLLTFCPHINDMLGRSFC